MLFTSQKMKKKNPKTRRRNQQKKTEQETYVCQKFDLAKRWGRTLLLLDVFVSACLRWILASSVYAYVRFTILNIKAANIWLTANTPHSNYNNIKYQLMAHSHLFEKKNLLILFNSSYSRSIYLKYVLSNSSKNPHPSPSKHIVIQTFYHGVLILVEGGG